MKLWNYIMSRYFRYEFLKKTIIQLSIIKTTKFSISNSLNILSWNQITTKFYHKHSIRFQSSKNPRLNSEKKMKSLPFPKRNKDNVWQMCMNNLDKMENKYPSDRWFNIYKYHTRYVKDIIQLLNPFSAYSSPNVMSSLNSLIII